MTGVNALMPLIARGGLRRGFKGGGNQGAGVNTLMGHLVARSWAADVAGISGDL
jgi:hypothetical protein